MKKIACMLVVFLIAKTLTAQTTGEKIERTGQQVESVVGTVNAIKGLFGSGKKKKTDSVNTKTTEKKKNSVKETDVLKSDILTRAAIAKLVFDKKETQEFLWKPQPQDKIDAITLDNLLSSDGMMHTEIAAILAVEETTATSYTALLATYLYGEFDGKLEKSVARAIGVGIGFANFIKNENGTWQLVGIKKIADRIGSDGILPEYALTNLGTNLATLSFTHGYGMGGQSETHQDFYALNPKYLAKKVFTLQTSESNDGGDNPKRAYEIVKDYKLLPTLANEEYPTITVTTRNGKTVKSTTVYNFSKEKGEYIGKTTTAKTATNAKAKSTPATKAATPKTAPTKEPVRAKTNTGW